MTLYQKDSMSLCYKCGKNPICISSNFYCIDCELPNFSSALKRLAGMNS